MKILLVVRPIGALLRYRAALYFLVQGGAGDAKVFGDFHLGDTETQHRFDLSTLEGVLVFECAAFCSRICVGHTERPDGVLAKIFHQIDSVCSVFFMCPISFYNEPSDHNR